MEQVQDAVDLQTFLRNRRSVRRFRPDPVPRPVLEQVLETAIYAPSAHNLQPWRFVVLTDPAVKRRLGLALTGAMRRDMEAEGVAEEAIAERVARSLRRLDEAPVVVLLCRDRTAVKVDRPEEHHMGVQSVALAGLQLLLAAHAAGLGGVWICWPLYAREEARSALNLPATWEPQGMVFLGYPAEAPAPPPRRPWQEVTLFVES